MRNKWLNAWYMYKGANSHICLVRWRADGEPIDRLAVQGLPGWRTAPKGKRNLTKPAEVWAEADALCAVLPEGTDLRAEAKCGSYTGWHVVSDGARDLCRVPLEMGVRGRR